MKVKVTISLVLVLFLCKFSSAQVWYPEGVFLHNTPALIKVDNQVITISKTGVDATNSYWLVCQFNGKSWEKLPILTLNKTAEISDMIRYQGMLYVSGNFTFNNLAATSLVRFDGNSWQGLAKFMKSAQVAAVLSLDVQDNHLILGGNFFNLMPTGGKSDTISHLARFNGLSKEFSHYFVLCKRCDPDNTVTDIVSNDTIVGISGSFTKIGNHTTKYLARIYKNGVRDTFLNTPYVLEKLALNGHVLFASGGTQLKDVRLYMIDKTIVDLKSNLDTVMSVHEILVLDGHLIANGVFGMLSNAAKNSIIRLDGSKWVDISNNYQNPQFIASGRGALFAIGNSAQPLSVWNPNRSVVRFFPGMSLLKVKVFLDSNNNCVREKNERPVSKQYIRIATRGALTNENGMAEFLMPNGLQNTQKFLIKPLRNHMRSNCADTIVNKTLVPGVYSDSIQFPLVRVPNINDIRVVLSSPKGAQVVKNKAVTYFITYENVGSNPISGKIRLNKNPKFSDLKTEPPATSLSASTYEWTYTNLQPGERKVLAYMGIADDTSFNDDQQFNAMASSSISTGTSQYIEDDVDSIPQLVSGTVNPFRKDVYPTPDVGDSITYLHVDNRDLRYQISFNNFSADTVFYAVVIDTLDLNLDMSYIQETGSNKSYYTEVQADPNNQYKGVLIWHFPNINLTPNPTMNFEILSSGSYIGFKVVTKPLSDGYMLKNVASVFYDNEYAGSTNAVYCSVAISDIDELEGTDKLKIYPNPFDHAFMLDCDLHAGDKVNIYGSNGQMVYQEAISTSGNNHVIDPGNLNSGIYILQVWSEGKLINKKLIKL
jgi:hypothetical protein